MFFRPPRATAHNDFNVLEHPVYYSNNICFEKWLYVWSREKEKVNNTCKIYQPLASIYKNTQKKIAFKIYTLYTVGCKKYLYAVVNNPVENYKIQKYK